MSRIKTTDMIHMIHTLLIGVPAGVGEGEARGVSRISRTHLDIRLGLGCDGPNVLAADHRSARHHVM